jgi:hypothetical protein
VQLVQAPQRVIRKRGQMDDRVEASEIRAGSTSRMSFRITGTFKGFGPKSHPSYR